MVLLTFCLVACGEDADPHVIGACTGWTDNLGNPFTGTCEAACKSPPSNTGKTCDTTVQLNCTAFDFEDLEGCCIPENNTTIKFVECSP